MNHGTEPQKKKKKNWSTTQINSALSQFHTHIITHKIKTIIRYKSTFKNKSEQVTTKTRKTQISKYVNIRNYIVEEAIAQMKTQLKLKHS